MMMFVILFMFMSDCKIFIKLKYKFMFNTTRQESV